MKQYRDAADVMQYLAGAKAYCEGEPFAPANEEWANGYLHMRNHFALRFPAILSRNALTARSTNGG